MISTVLLKYIKNVVLLYFHSSKIEKAVLTFTGVIFYYTYLYFYSSTWSVYFALSKTHLVLFFYAKCMEDLFTK